MVKLFPVSVIRRLSLVTCLSLVTLLSLALTPRLSATSMYVPEPTFVMEGAKAAPWAFIERHEDPHPRFPWEPRHPKLKIYYPLIAEAFGSLEPHSRAFLLHGMPAWREASRPHPVLLLPGANDDATMRYARPLPLAHPKKETTPGLAQYLQKRGYAVFGVTFSHYQGCNVHQGEAVANAITRIRRLMGREEDPSFQVDIVTYSKSIMSARSYMSNAKDFLGLKHLTSYRGDVRRVVFQCGPVAGMDTPFRYYLYNVANIAKGFPAPIGAHRMLLYGAWQDLGQDHILSGAWPGVTQTMYDLRKIGLGYRPASWTSDANWTMVALRDGGTSMFLASYGIDAVAKAGGNMIENLNARGLPPEVTVAIVAGNFPVLFSEQYPCLYLPEGMEPSHESDGCVYVKSCLYTEGLTAQGARVLSTKVFALNHLQLSRSEKVYAHVFGQLERP